MIHTERDYDLALARIELLESTIKLLSFYFCKLFPEESSALRVETILAEAHAVSVSADAAAKMVIPEELMTVEDARRLLRARRSPKRPLPIPTEGRRELPKPTGWRDTFGGPVKVNEK